MPELEAISTSLDRRRRDPLALAHLLGDLHGADPVPGVDHQVPGGDRAQRHEQDGQRGQGRLALTRRARHAPPARRRRFGPRSLLIGHRTAR
jgi:hypothetical protein